MIWRIEVLKVETDIIISITESPKAWAKKLVKIYVETFKTDLTVFIGNIIAFDIQTWFYEDNKKAEIGNRKYWIYYIKKS